MTDPTFPTPPPPSAANSVDGLFKGLTDLTFTKFITIKFAAVIYVILSIVTVLAWIFAVITAFSQNAGFGFATLLLGWIFPLLSIIFTRMYLELAVSLVRTAQNTSRIADKA